ncbi:MAG UNVERIFIED_CONTAM: hypothetical protein LVR18_44595 [Planctomycetaceae bacterium]
MRIAELQLWRVTIAQRDTLQISDVERLQERSREFSRAMRGAGEYLCGRAYRQLGDSDRAPRVCSGCRWPHRWIRPPADWRFAKRPRCWRNPGDRTPRGGFAAYARNPFSKSAF